MQVAIDEAPAERGVAACLEIHRDERHFADRVDPAQFRVELDTVERRDAAVEQRDVVEVQVAVTFAHESGAAAPVDLRGNRFLVQIPVFEPVEGLGQPLGRQRARQLIEVFRAPVRDRARRSELAVGRRALAVGVKFGNSPSERVDQRRVEPSVGGLRAQQVALRETAHPDRVLDRRAVAVQPRRIDAAEDRRELEIDLGREAAIQPQLFLAVEAAPLEAREIDEAKADRFLDLVGEVAGENHPRDVGFDAFEVVRRVTESVGVGERRDQLRGKVPGV